MRSLQAKLVTGTAVGTAVVLLAAGLVVYFLVRSRLVEQFDRSLVGRATLLASAVEQEDGEVDLEFDEFDLSEFRRPGGTGYLELWQTDGSVLYRSPSLGEGDLERPASPGRSPTCRWLSLEDGRTGRAVEFSFLGRTDGGRDSGGRGVRLNDLPEAARAAVRREAGASPVVKIERKTEGGRTIYEAEWRVDGGKMEVKVDEGGGLLKRELERGDGPQEVGSQPATRAQAGPLTLVLARDAAPLLDALGTLRAVLLAVGLTAVGASAAVLGLIVRRSLAPLNRAAERISRLHDRNLGERLRDDDVPGEMQPVIARLNELLGRLDVAFRRERQFSADVAHDLRTPLAGLRSTTDVALSRERPAAEYHEAIADCRRIVLQMQAMVEKLLSLARLEAGAVELHVEPVVLDDVVSREWRSLEETARARKLEVRLAQEARRAVRTDATLLGLVVRSILDNAVRHADEGGTVEIESGCDDHAARLRVANTGSAVAQSQAHDVFERFWRGDAARSRAADHCGLGLSLVQRAVAALGGTADVTSRAGGWFEIAVTIPSR